ncbi:MAG: hypothetical protein H7Z43_07160 [Clostridia bacterium]|nr:hypothetical protein [Deltaproteobacteria bacterium]
MRQLVEMSVIAILVSVTSDGCASKKDSEKPPIATMTSTGGTEVTRADGETDEPINAIPECKKVITCYNALARNLCLNSSEDCTASFRVTTPVDKPETCRRLLSQAAETAKPFMSKEKHKMPSECS